MPARSPIRPIALTTAFVLLVSMVPSAVLAQGEEPAADTPTTPARVPPTPRGYAGLGSPYPGGGGAGGLPEGTPPGVALRLRLLDQDVGALAFSDGSSAIANDIVRIVLGGVLVGLGFAMDDKTFGALLWTMGGFSVAGGAVGLLLWPRPASQAIAYQHMAATTRSEVRTRLHEGERLLRSTAHRARAARLVEGSLTIVGTGVAVGLFVSYLDSTGADELTKYLFIAALATGAIAGVVSLVSPTLAERRWDAYSEVRDRLRRERRHASITPFAGALPGRGAAGLAGIAGSF